MNYLRAIVLVKYAQFADRFLKAVAEKGFQIAGSILLGGITLLIFVNVISRYLFNAPLDFSQEIVEINLALIGLMAIAICTSKQGHVSIGILVNKFPPKVQAVIESVGFFLATAIFGIMSWRFFKYALANPEPVTNILRLPKYIFIIVIGFISIVITLLFLTQFIRILRRTPSSEPH